MQPQKQQKYKCTYIIILWQVRNDMNLSLRALSELSGVSKTTINRIENNQVKPKIDTINKIAIALNTDLCKLYKKIITQCN